MRPTTFKVDNTIYWTIRTYTDAGVLVDADSTPSVDVRKNGAATADSVTVTKRAATTGIYDCSYNPAGEAEGDSFTIEETATISSQAYENAWCIEAQAAERGTDNVTSGASASDVVTAMQAVADDFKADTSALATQSSVDSIDGDVQNIGSDVSTILADTNELQQNQGNWLTATGFSTFDASVDTVTTDTASRDASKADVSGLSTFDHTTDQVVASNMRGTDGANTVAPDNASITAILADTNELQLNQGSWLTATGFATPSDCSTDAEIYTYFTSLSREDAFKATGFNTVAPDNTTINDINNALPNNLSLMDIDSSGAVLSQLTPEQIYLYMVASNRSDLFKADVSGLSTFDASTDQVVASNMRGTDNALLASAAPANWSTLIVGTGVDAGKVTTSNPAAGSGSNHTAQDVANLILVTPANKLATDASGNVEANNMRGTDGANTVAPVDVSADVAAILADTNELQTNQGNWLTADVSGLASQASIDALNNFDPANDVVANVTLVDTTTNLTNGGGGGGGASAADIYDYFTDGTREDAFKADTSGLSTFDPANDVVARVTLVDTTTDLTNQTAGGVGMFQASVLITDDNGNALQGARVNVDGTTLSLTTGVSGTVQFNLDSGVYLLNVLPPANYDTPSGQVITITSSDPAQTVFTLTSTSPPDGCDVPWIG